MNKRKWKFNFGSILYLLHFVVFCINIWQKFTVALIWFHSFFSRKRVKFELLSLFSRNEKWNHFPFHSFREMKSELIFDFTLFEKWKWNWKASRSRSRGEMWKKFSRNETLAGYWHWALSMSMSMSIDHWAWALIISNALNWAWANFFIIRLKSLITSMSRT